MRLAPCVVLPASFTGSLPHHEAGHAVAALVLGLPCEGAFVRAEKAAGGFYMHPPSESESAAAPDSTPEFIAALDELVARVHLPAAGEKDRALAMGTMFAAGREAEMIHAGLRLDGCLLGVDSDTHRARAMLAAHWGAGTAALYHCQRQARQLLETHWTAVEHIARALAENGRWLPDAFTRHRFSAAMPAAVPGFWRESHA